MLHEMKLRPVYFDLIQAGEKTIEIRLNDEKRQEIKIGDMIRFQKEPELQETLDAEVIGLLRYKKFEDMYNDLPHKTMGFEGKTTEEMVNITYEFYTPEREQNYGALGIKIRI
ncbi:MAG TPA: hypothetical protein DEP72_02730 [Clostridiales bacterium]|nr:MAG: hypothetical protein A2Y18_08175 [Clostridiales bacterium GWD2_32_19]HCC07070.1 hypothetical protein [Clostridiales bacterium]